MTIEELSIEELKRGYKQHPSQGGQCCAVCGRVFEAGEVHPMGGRLYESARAVELHMEEQHPDYLEQLIANSSKYNSLTDHQRQLMRLFAAGAPDKEIAKELGVSPSTVRHQKFMFREKAKQARLYLAVYERVFQREQPPAGAIVPIHDHAKMVDERYVVTQEEREHILRTSFLSLEPLRLREFSPKEKKKVVILAKIAEQFQPGLRYPEKEVNRILSAVFADFATLRRYLIQYGYMERAKDCSQYWRTT